MSKSRKIFSCGVAARDKCHLCRVRPQKYVTRTHPSAPSALNAAEQTPFKSPQVSAKVMAKKRFAEEKAELHEHLAHLEAQPNPDLLSPDTVAQLYAAKDTMSPRGKRAVERALKRNLTRTQIGVMLYCSNHCPSLRMPHTRHTSCMCVMCSPPPPTTPSDEAKHRRASIASCSYIDNQNYYSASDSSLGSPELPFVLD